MNDDRPLGWFVYPITTTLIAIGCIPFGIGVACGAVQVANAPIGLLAFVATVFGCGPLMLATRGGVILRPTERELVRWWGPMFPIHSRVIPMKSIGKVRLFQCGRSTEDELQDYGISIAVDDQWIDVRIGLSGREKAYRFSRALADEIGCEHVNDAHAGSRKSAKDRPAASTSLTLFAISALLLFWMPVLGLGMLGYAAYLGARHSYPYWLSFALVPAMFPAFIATVLGIVGLAIEIGWLR